MWGVGRHSGCTARFYSSSVLMKDSSTKTPPPPPPTTADLAEEAMDGQGVDPKMTVMGGGDKEKAADYANCECCCILSCVFRCSATDKKQHNPFFTVFVCAYWTVSLFKSVGVVQSGIGVELILRLALGPLIFSVRVGEGRPPTKYIVCPCWEGARGCHTFSLSIIARCRSKHGTFGLGVMYPSVVIHGQLRVGAICHRTGFRRCLTICSHPAVWCNSTVRCDLRRWWNT